MTEWSAEPDDPRTGLITLDPVPAYGEDDLGLVWDEERGWTLVWGTDDSGRHTHFAALSDGPLPTPDELTTAVQEAFRVRLPGDTVTGGAYRYQDDQDDGFEGRLTSYTR